MMERESSYEMMEMERALEIVIETALESRTADVVVVPVRDALGCIAVRDVLSAEDFPPFAASIMDGYAVNSSDGAGVFNVVGHVVAGEAPIVIKPGQVAYITTGAPVPAGADAVIQVELTSAIDGDDTRVRLHEATPTGKFIRAIGSDIGKSARLIPAGAIITPADIALLITVGVGEVAVYAPVRVGVISTGSELVDKASPGIAQIRDSNRPMLLAALEQLDSPIQTFDLGIVRDSTDSLEARFNEALLSVDLLISTGGVSMGSHDFVKPYLKSAGDIKFGRLMMKPGKPTTFATVQSSDDRSPPKLVFALPGNPVSALVCFQLLVMPAIKTLQHISPATYPMIPVVVAHSIRPDPERPEYHRAHVFFDATIDSLAAVSTGSQLSSRMLSMCGANGLICIPAQSSIIPSGTQLPCLLIDALQNKPRSIPTDLPATSSCSHHHHASSSTIQSHLEANTATDVTVALLTCSDRSSQGIYDDITGPSVAGFLQSITGYKITATSIVPDNVMAIRKALIALTDSESAPDVILTLGGTGLCSTDVTPEATTPILDKMTPALVTAMLIDGLIRTPHAMLSRAVAGIRKRTLIVNLVGSPKGALENINALLPTLPHAIALIKQY